MQHHVLTPAHPFENGARAGHSSHGESRTQCLAKGRDIGSNSVVLLAAARCVIEWRGSEYTATDPRVLRLEVVGQRLSRRRRAFLTLIGVRRYLMLKASAPNP